jgi:bacteriocin-like protein
LEKEVIVMKNLEDIKEQEKVLNDEELDHVTGGIRVTPYATLIEREKNATIQQSDEAENNC